MSARTYLAAPALLAAMVGCRDDTPLEPETTTPAPAVAAAVGSDSWITRAKMPTRTYFAAATVTNAAGESVVYAIGGLNPYGVPVDKVIAYNVATDAWTFRRPLPIPLARSNGAGVIDGKIYISGGESRDPNFPTNALYVYDPATNRWTRKRDIPPVRSGPEPWAENQYGFGNGVTGVIKGKLYVVSGCFTAWEPWGYFEQCNPLFFRYNPATDRWVVLPPPFTERTFGATIGGVIGGKFYVMASSSSTREARFAVYDPATNQWTARTPLGLARPGAASAVLGGKLYVMGGTRYNAKTDTFDTLDITIVYDPAADAWTRRASMPSPRRGIAGSTVMLNGKPRIEVLGGTAPGNNIQYIP